MMKNRLVRAALSVVMTGVAVSAPSLVSAAGHGGGFAIVSNGADSGQGSLRHAIEEARASHIFIKQTVSSITINSPLVYDKTSKLLIKGHGQTVNSSRNINLLSVTQGADLEISDLNFRGPGGFNINNRGDQGQSAGKGIFVDVRDDQTGTVKVTLSNVTVSDVANHGIHISDCSLADDCGGGGGGGGKGSAASIEVNLHNVTVDNVGNGRFDADGLRVDDRGDGDIVFIAENSTFINVGADGVELDEGNDGDVIAQVRDSRFDDNGAYCDPDVLAPFVPTPDEAEFADTERLPGQIPGIVAGSPDDSCIEREVELYDSGYVEVYEFGIDLDDGFDIDEAGPGSLVANIRNSVINGNLDEGIDFDEEDSGMIFARFVNTSAAVNRDDGFKFSEEDEGSVIGRVTESKAMNNGGKGFVFEEEGDGDLLVSVNESNTSNNDDSDDTGIEAVQEDDGQGMLRVDDSDIDDGIDTNGVDER